MNVGELRTHFKEILNRDDCTDTLADTFMTFGVRRVERLLRTSFQAKTTLFTVDETWPGYLLIPTDYLSMKTLHVDGIQMRKAGTGAGQEGPDVGDSESFYVEGSKIYFKPGLKETSVIKLNYHYEFSESVSDELPTTYSLIIPDLTIYAALVFAADYFVDERSGAFTTTLTGLIGEVQAMADLEEMSGGYMAVANPYEGII